MPGTDLSHYEDELARERNSRTLTLRRRNRPALDSARRGGRYGCATDAGPFPYLSAEKSIAALASGAPAVLAGLAAQLTAALACAPRPLRALVRSPGFLCGLAAALSAPPAGAAAPLLDLVIAVFPLLGARAGGFVDGGLCFALGDFLASDDAAVAQSAVRAVRAICSHSSYARDSVLCLEIHTALVRMAIASSPSAHADLCCTALLAIFANPDPIEPEILANSVDQLCELLMVGSVQTVASVLDCLVAMTNQHSALVHSLYDLGLFERIVQLMERPSLVAPTLRLIGNLSAAQPFQLRAMLDAGLPRRLFAELESEHAAEAFWVLSNLLEAVAGLIIPLIDEKFIARLLERMESSSYHTQKEVAFFLSTLLLFLHEADLRAFVVPQVVGVLVSMIGCGIEKVTLRCIDAIGKCIRYLQTHADRETVRCLAESDLVERLGELLDEREQPLLAERAEALITQFHALENSDEL
jgi:hypothetical protein